MCELYRVGCLGPWEWVGAGVSWGVGMGYWVCLVYLGMGYGSVGCWGVAVWDGSIVLTGFFRWVLSWGLGSGLVQDRGSGGCVCSFAGREW